MNKDHSDEKVRGSDRYIPTSRAKLLLWSILPTPAVAYIPIAGVIEKIKPEFQPTEQALLSIVLCLFVSILISFLLILELTVVIYQSKHSKIHHYTYSAPEMNYKWLKLNATKRHYVFLAIIFIAGIATGVGYKSL